MVCGAVQICYLVVFGDVGAGASGGEKAAGEARGALRRLLARGCMELEPLALGEREGVSKAWAGRTLA